MVDLLSTEENQVIGAFAADNPYRISYTKLLLLLTRRVVDGSCLFGHVVNGQGLPVHKVIRHGRFLVLRAIQEWYMNLRKLRQKLPMVTKPVTWAKDFVEMVRSHLFVHRSLRY